MANPFVAEIRIFPFNFAPKGWTFCDGQLMPISQNTALFSLLGTTYGDDGKSNFALPNLQGSVPMHPGGGPGLTLRDLGETGGSDQVTLLVQETPPHTHSLMATTAAADDNDPGGNTLARPTSSMYAPLGPAFSMGNALLPAGGNLPHNNMQPYLALFFCIALQGVFPPRP